MPQPARLSPPLPVIRQLLLPLAEPPGPAPPLLPEVARLQPHQIWATLPPAVQGQVRLAVLCILQEGITDADRC